MNRLRVRPEDNTFCIETERSSTFEEFARGYLDRYRMVEDAKRPATLRTEAVCLRRWCEQFGPKLRVRQITKAHVNSLPRKWNYLAPGWGGERFERMVESQVAARLRPLWPP